MQLHVFSLYEICNHLTPECRKLLIQVHVFPHILYCVSAWDGAPRCRLDRVQHIINCAASIAWSARWRDHMSTVIKSIAWYNLRELVNHRDCFGISRVNNNPCASVAIRSLFSPRSAVSARHTRSTLSGTLQLPAFRLSLPHCVCSFRAASSCNRLSTIIQSPHELFSLKSLFP